MCKTTTTKKKKKKVCVFSYRDFNALLHSSIDLNVQTDNQIASCPRDCDNCHMSVCRKYRVEQYCLSLIGSYRLGHVLNYLKTNNRKRVEYSLYKYVYTLLHTTRVIYMRRICSRVVLLDQTKSFADKQTVFL